MATSSVVVDISGDNDSAGAVAAASSIPSGCTDSPFERSCDNPECSAPKLISLVPKRETPEFITEPVIMSQPTLINGFTTVFQIDGIAAKMNDIMSGEQDVTPGSSNGKNNQPQSVFRIVPNTHAHIVNYVVVDGAGETMRKIKANDADTMRKLLDSQRLSAEQMLRKLIGKALKTTPARQPEPQVPLPIPNKVPKKVFATPVAPVSTISVPAQAPVAGPLPVVPPGITITAIPLPETLQVGPPPSQPMSSVSISAPTPVETPPIPASTSAGVATSTPILRQSLGTVNQDDLRPRGPGRPSGVKRKVQPNPEPETIKKLRPRSPKQKTPYAIGLKPASSSPPPPKKLPTLPKLPTKPPVIVPVTVIKPRPKKPADGAPPAKAAKLAPTEPEEFDDSSSSMLSDSSFTSSEFEMPMSKGTQPSATKPSAVLPNKFRPLPTLPTRKLLVAPPKPKDASPATTADPPATKVTAPQTLPVKAKPMMGPASKMNALKAIAAAKALAQAPKTDLTSKITAALASKSSVTRIGETVITSTSSAASKADAATTPKIKPCSVPISKIEAPAPTPKSNEPLNRSEGTPKLETSSPMKPLVTPNKDAAESTGTAKAPSHPPQRIMVSRPIKAFLKPTPEKDPLAIETEAPTTTTTTKSYSAPRSKVDTSPVTRTSSGLISKAAPSKPSKEEEPSTARGSLSKSGEPSTTKAKPTAITSKSDATLEPKTPSRSEGPSVRTRGSTPKTPTPTTSKTGRMATTPATPKVLRVVLPSLKSGVLTIPMPRSAPHPNLKISSVISGGNAVAATLGDSDSATTERNSPNIEKLQQELAYLRRTVSRLNKRKT